MGFPEPGISPALPPPFPGHSCAFGPPQSRAAGEGRLGFPGDPAVGAASTPGAAQPHRAGPGSGRRCAFAREPATEGGGGEGATEAGRGVGESSRAVYGLSEAADL